MIVPNDADPLVSKTMLTPVAPHTFRMKTANHFGDNGELATFELDDLGTVTRLKTGEDYLFPVEEW